MLWEVWKGVLGMEGRRSRDVAGPLGEMMREVISGEMMHLHLLP